MSGCTIWWSRAGADRGKPWAVRHQADFYICESWTARCGVVSKHCDGGFTELPNGPRGVVECPEWSQFHMRGHERIRPDQISEVRDGPAAT